MPLKDILNRQMQEHQAQQNRNVTMSALDMTESHRPQDTRRDITPATSGQVFDVYQKRQELLRLAESEMRANPKFSEALKDAVLGASVNIGLPTAEALGRTLNFDIATSTGLMRGMIRSLKGEGTPLEGFQTMVAMGNASSLLLPLVSPTTRQAIKDSIRENAGFNEIFEEAGIEAGPRIPIGFRSPKLKRNQYIGGYIMPSHVAMGIVEDLAQGKNPIRGYDDFTATFTPRGAVGLALDILLSPITYLSFGTNIPRKMAVKLVAEGKTEKSVVRFLNQTLITDKQLKRSTRALKSSKLGRQVIRTMDDILSVEIKGHPLKSIPSELFDDGYRILKPIHRMAKNAKREISRNSSGIAESWAKKFVGWTPEEKLFFFRRARLMEKALRNPELRKMGVGIFADPKMNKMVMEINNFFRPLAKKLGMTDDVLYDVYMPAVFTEVRNKYIRAGAKRQIFKTQKITAAMRKRFVEKPGLITDPEEAIVRKGIEMMRAERINNGFIKRVIRMYGKKADEAQKLGIDEFFPEDIRRVFKGTRYEAQALKEAALGEAAKHEKIFLPNRVIESMERIAKQNKLTTNQFLRAYDVALNAFKTLQTVIFPAFHMRNAFSNKFQRFLQEGGKAFKGKDDLLALQMIRGKDLGQTFIDIPGKAKMSLQKALKLAKKRGLVAEESHLVDEIVGGLERAQTDEITTRLQDFFNLDPAKNNFVRLARCIGRDVENQARLASYVRSLQDGYSVNEAVQIAFASLFDYAGGTRFEKNFMKRVVPFYTFAKKNLQLQTRALMKNPGRQASLFKMIKDLRNDALNALSPEQREAFNNVAPNWLKDTWAIPVGIDPQEGPMFLTGFGFAQQDMFDLFNLPGLTFRVSPLITVPMELIGSAMQNSAIINEKLPLKEARFLFPPEVRGQMQGKKIQEFLDLAQDGRFGSVARDIQRVFKFQVGKRPIFKGGKVVGEEPVLLADKTVVKALQGLIVARMMSTARQWQDPNIDNMNKLMRTMFGLSIIRSSLSKQSAIEKKKIQAALGTHLKQTGEGYVMQLLGSQDPDIKRILKQVRKVQE